MPIIPSIERKKTVVNMAERSTHDRKTNKKGLAMRPDLMPTNKLTKTPIGPARIEGAPSTRYRLNELILTPAGSARIAGVFHDKQNGRTQAIVALEGQPFEGFTNSARLAYVDWDQIKRVGSNQPKRARVGATSKPHWPEL